MLCLSLLASLCDVSDHPIFTLTGILVSGHTAKHVAAALAVYWVVRCLCNAAGSWRNKGRAMLKGKQIGYRQKSSEESGNL